MKIFFSALAPMCVALGPEAWGISQLRTDLLRAIDWTNSSPLWIPAAILIFILLKHYLVGCEVKGK